MATYITNHDLPYDTHNTYDVFFSGDTIFTTVTADPATVSSWISDIRSIHHYRLRNLIVGLDVEWRPSYTRNLQNPVATVQICVGRRCLVYQIIHTDYIPQSLADFLSDDDFTFVGVSVQSDLDKLDAEYGIGRYARSVDLRRLAADAYGRAELKQAGMKYLASLVLGKEVEKPRRVTMSNWDNRWLTDDQVLYACIDAFVSFEIGRVLNASSY
ncbi:werner syndrome-like exonuclease [Phtheirospermum japonicum]|uniref:Werner syndrome-like exonuclease n=1 Tax=Phtheirospermum japonicum TaxID=374723 RepID=A0A830BLE2_9LAMI|nr:werner syndrome-like exonuclease [Phtheirospermum japonicum]